MKAATDVSRVTVVEIIKLVGSRTADPLEGSASLLMAVVAITAAMGTENSNFSEEKLDEGLHQFLDASLQAYRASHHG